MQRRTLKVMTACEMCVHTACLVYSMYIYYRTCDSSINAPLRYFKDKVGERGSLQAMWHYMGSYVLVTFIFKQGFQACDVRKAVRVERPLALKWLRRKWRRISARP